MVAAGKLLLTYRTLVGFHPRVGAPVSRELIRPREPPSAALPVAGEGLLPRVPPQVGLQVAALGVHLGAARKSAFVHFDKIRHWVLLELLTSNKNACSLVGGAIAEPERLGCNGDRSNAHKLGGNVKAGGGQDVGHQGKGLTLDVD